jgi:hypothetical protein
MTEGLSDYRIAVFTGIPRPTVQRWRRPEHPRCAHVRQVDWRVPDAEAYCYLLGCYLGDGHVIRRSRNGWELRLACDQRYTGIMAEIVSSIARTFPGARPTSFAASNGASDVLRVSRPAVGRAFPQHGPGRKHLRPIALADWQLELTRSYPAPLIRG